jgi:hypothetical protein
MANFLKGERLIGSVDTYSPYRLRNLGTLGRWVATTLFFNGLSC